MMRHSESSPVVSLALAWIILMLCIVLAGAALAGSAM
jgi:hypothetical protein